MVYAEVSKTSSRKAVWVRLPPCPLTSKIPLPALFFVPAVLKYENMTLEVTSDEIGKISSDCTVFFFFEGKTFSLTKSFENLPKNKQDEITHALSLFKFKAKSKETVLIPQEQGSIAGQILAVGLGKKDEFDHNELRKAVASAVKQLKGKVSSIVIPIAQESEFSLSETAQAHVLTEGIKLGSYSFGKYQKKEEKEEEIQSVTFATNSKSLMSKVTKGIKEGELFANATIVARNLINEPSDVVTPTHLANFALDIAKGFKEITCKIFDRDEAEKMGMNAFLGVARGAETPPKFIYLHYKPKQTKNKNPSTSFHSDDRLSSERAGYRKLAIVGKGITFDSGGINVKTGDSMQTMKEDMSGGAAVLAVFSVISEIAPPFEVMGLIAATPNLISGKSIVPGDIVKAFNGKTIEVLNTDAEGRVTMADSLSYAVKQGATEIIDLATLTGAIRISLGTNIAGLFSNNEQLSEEITKSAQKSGEKVWEMPLEKEYKELNKSEIADIANIPSSRYGGAITAALFLADFVGKTPWVHLDIAGPAFFEKNFDLGPKGGTGFGVRLLLHYLQGNK